MLAILVARRSFEFTLMLTQGLEHDDLGRVSSLEFGPLFVDLTPLLWSLPCGIVVNLLYSFELGYIVGPKAVFENMSDPRLVLFPLVAYFFGCIGI